MEQEKIEERGEITVGIGKNQRKIKIIDFVQSVFKENRLVSVCGLEDGSIFIAVENPQSSGRNPQVSIWLSPESVMGVIQTCILYFGCKGQNIEELFLNSTKNHEMVDFVYSDNLKGLGEIGQE